MAVAKVPDYLLAEAVTAAAILLPWGNHSTPVSVIVILKKLIISVNPYMRTDE